MGERSVPPTFKRIVMAISYQNIQYMQKLILSLSANVIPDEKSYLISLRINSLAKEKGFDSVQEFIEYLRIRPPADLHHEAVEAMMNNETSFFRESRSFEAVEKVVLPMLVEQRSRERTLNIWSAGCSTGQEPYSIAMLLHEQIPDIAQWHLKITASEYSKRILTIAKEGRYSKLTINRGLPQHLLVRYFEKVTIKSALDAVYEWQIRDEIRKLVKFQQLNLEKPWPPFAQMDIIFMRNILIYFSDETKKKILERVHRVLRPDGYLFLGSAETITNLHSSFERVQVERTVAYRLRK